MKKYIHIKGYVKTKRLIIIAGLVLSGAIQIKAQEFINTRKITMSRGDTTIIAGILADLKLESVDQKASYYWYSNSGIFSNQGGFSGNLLHGDYLEYDSEGHLILKGEFCRGLKSGDWISWYANGYKKSTCAYKNGKKQGKLIEYNPKGELVQQFKYRSDKLHGYATEVKRDTTYRVFYFQDKAKREKAIHVKTEDK